MAYQATPTGQNSIFEDRSTPSSAALEAFLGLLRDGIETLMVVLAFYKVAVDLLPESAMNRHPRLKIRLLIVAVRELPHRGVMWQSDYIPGITSYI